MATAGGLWRRAGGPVLNPPPLNLLRYPSRIPRVDAGLRRQALGALLVGALAGSGLLVWQNQRHAQLQAERERTQARVQMQLRQQAERRQALTLAQSQARLIERAQAWQAQRQQFLQLHAQLQQQAREGGLRLQRWQADGHKLSLQLWLPHTEGVPAIVARLTQASPQAWTLQSLASQSDPPGVQAVLEAVWPAAPAGGRRP